jgi:acyl dehydratase
MALNTDIVGIETGPWQRSWTTADTLLYALGVGAGQDDPTAELNLTTENTEGIPQQALGSFAIVLAQAGGPPSDYLAGVDLSKLLHAEQALTLHSPLPTSGAIEVRSKVVDLFDKGSGALLGTEAEGADPAKKTPLFTSRSGVFLRGEGGFGGDRGPSVPTPIPQREPDESIGFTTAPNQALVYRLSGDRNPLHSDPAYAAAGGFDQPILHGLATYGITTRLLVRACCGSDPARMTHIEGRFTKPVLPGDRLDVEIWRESPGAVAFRTRSGSGNVVLDRGRFQFAA